jgi:hypothetical protein
MAFTKIWKMHTISSNAMVAELSTSRVPKNFFNETKQVCAYSETTDPKITSVHTVQSTSSSVRTTRTWFDLAQQTN